MSRGSWSSTGGQAVRADDRVWCQKFWARIFRTVHVQKQGIQMTVIRLGLTQYDPPSPCKWILRFLLSQSPCTVRVPKPGALWTPSKCVHNFASLSIFLGRKHQLIKGINVPSNTRITVLGRWGGLLGPTSSGRFHAMYT